MTAPFKAGDKVICVDATSKQYIKQGRPYEVEDCFLSSGKWFVRLVKESGDHYAHRFKPASGPDVADRRMILSGDAKVRKDTPITTGVLDYFPRAMAAVAQCSKAGNDQHNPGQPLHWAKGKSTDHADCIARHLIDRHTVDTDGIKHAAKLAWRALALLETMLEEEEKK